jgi:hypothetical protein
MRQRFNEQVRRPFQRRACGGLFGEERGPNFYKLFTRARAAFLRVLM